MCKDSYFNIGRMGAGISSWFMKVRIGASIREAVMKGHTRDRFKKIDHSIPH